MLDGLIDVPSSQLDDGGPAPGHGLRLRGEPSGRLPACAGRRRRDGAVPPVPSRGERSDDDRERADAILDAVNDVKGPFAQDLAALLDDPDVDFTVPSYLLEAITWVTA